MRVTGARSAAIVVVMTRQQCAARDAADPLGGLRSLFALEGVDADGVIYLDGNSLGVLPKATPARLLDVTEQEWGHQLIRSWNTAGWITLSRRIADKIARLIGVGPGEVVVADSTSINLHKILHAALAARDLTRVGILSERTNFPTDLYIAETLARQHGLELILADTTEIAARVDDRVAIVMLTHVNYRTGYMHDMDAISGIAHDAGALMVWDLSHSAGAVPIELREADFAVGCGYKYLNGGPGAPAFAWAHPEHIAWMDDTHWRQPLSGWLGHASPFAFDPKYQPASGMARFICGTPPVLSLAALECGVDTVLAAEEAGGMAAIRAKSVALTQLFIDLVEERCGELTLASPRGAAERGSQVSFAHPTHGYEIMQALIARGVIGDFRAPDILRFGFTPLYTRFTDVWDAVDRLRAVLESGEWRDAKFSVRATVT
jgi:kynureninase